MRRRRTPAGPDAAVLAYLGTLSRLEELETPTGLRQRAAVRIRSGSVQTIAGQFVDGLTFADLKDLDASFDDPTSAIRVGLIDTRVDVPRGKLAEELLDGLRATLRLPIAPSETLHHRTTEVGGPWQVSLRLAQLALWLCRSAPQDTRARAVLPRATETVFLLASLPLRVHDAGSEALIGPLKDHDDELAVERALALHAHWRATDAPQVLLAARSTEQARDDWLAILDRAEHHPMLLADGPDTFDERLRWLIQRHPPVRDGWLHRTFAVFRADPLLRLPPMGDDDAQRVRHRERELLLRVVSDHLLPRYLLNEAFGVLLPLAEGLRGGGRWLVRMTARALLLLPIVAGIATFVGAAAASPAVRIAGRAEVTVPPIAQTLAGSMLAGVRVVAVLWVLSAIVTVAIAGRAGSYLGLLRLPAAVAFGLAIVWSLPPSWLATTLAAPELPLMLATLSIGYLLVEVVNQGAESYVRILSRSLLVGSIGLGTAMLVTTLVTFVVGPPVEPGTSGTFATVQQLLLSSTAALTVGVFLQAIWDESPVTSPLSRLRLR